VPAAAATASLFLRVSAPGLPSKWVLFFVPLFIGPALVLLIGPLRRLLRVSVSAAAVLLVFNYPYCVLVNLFFLSFWLRAQAVG
jgi:hypothetical protein